MILATWKMGSGGVNIKLILISKQLIFEEGKRKKKKVSKTKCVLYVFLVHFGVRI